LFCDFLILYSSEAKKALIKAGIASGTIPDSGAGNDDSIFAHQFYPAGFDLIPEIRLRHHHGVGLVVERSRCGGLVAKPSPNNKSGSYQQESSGCIDGTWSC
jgi:hypothetical protein